MDTVERFWSKVDKSGDCWLWTDALCPKGYGQFWDGVYHMRPHRYSFALEYGPIANELMIDHRCHTPACVRPTHLRRATNKQNGENRKGASRNSKSGVRGVYWDKRVSKWRAELRHNGKRVHVGYFDDLAIAGREVAEARQRIFTHSIS